MVDLRNNLTRQVEAEVRSHFGDRVYQTKIPRNVRLSEAPSHGMPALLYDPQSAGSKAYTDLCYEILNRLELSDPPLSPPALACEVAATSDAPEAASGTSPSENPQTGSTGGINGQFA